MLDRTARPLVVLLMAGVAAYFAWHVSEVVSGHGDAGTAVGVFFLAWLAVEVVLLARRMARR